LLALKKSLTALPKIQKLTVQFQAALFQWKDDLRQLRRIADLIEKTIREDAPPTANEGGIIRKGYNAELDELIDISKDGKSYLARLESQEKAATGINSLKVRYNKVFGYYIEIPRTHSESVPLHYVRKQTLVNAERYITEELKNFETKVLGAEDRRAALEYQIFQEIRAEVVKHHADIHRAAQFLAQSDCLLNWAVIAEENNYCRPELNIEGLLLIEDGRHPVIEKMICSERFVPNTIRMDDVLSSRVPIWQGNPPFCVKPLWLRSWRISARLSRQEKPLSALLIGYLRGSARWIIFLRDKAPLWWKCRKPRIS